MFVFQQQSERCWELTKDEILPCILEKSQGDYYAWVLAGLTALILGIFIYLIKLYYNPEKIEKNRELLKIYRRSLQEEFKLNYFATGRIIRNKVLKKEILFYARLKKQESILISLLAKKGIGNEKPKNLEPFFRILINGLRNSSIFQDKADLLEQQLTTNPELFINESEKRVFILQEILHKKEIRVGWFIYPPFIDEDNLNSNSLKGIYPLLVNEIARKYQLKILWKQITLGDAVEMIKGRKIDIVVSVFQTPKRSREVDFTAFLHSVTVGGVTRKSINDVRSQSESARIFFMA